MSVTDTLPDSLIVDRLRANLRAASIAYTEADIDAIAAAGLFTRVESFEALVKQYTADSMPDYLGGAAHQNPSPGNPSVSPDAGRGTPAQPVSKTRRGEAEIASEALSRRFPFGDQRSLVEVAALVRTRAVSPVELAVASFEAIARSDSDLHAFQLVLADQALATAHEAEQEIMGGTYRGPLHGIPIAVKDLLAMAGTPTTAGSRALANWIPSFDATAVARLKQAGAVIIGKTRMSEFAYWPGSSNPHYGPTNNPWNLAHDTGGSSSGSGAAVASGAVFSALGTDTGGSIRIPAANCGIVGLKPTFGRASLFGAVPLAWSLDHIGPMTRTVADAACMLEVLSGADPADPRTAAIPVPPYGHIVAEAVKRAQLEPMRIGVLITDGSASPLGSSDATAPWYQGLAVLERCGATLVPIDIPELHQLRTLNNAILAIEAAAYHAPMLVRQLDGFGSFIRARLLSSFAYGPTTFVRAQQVRALLRRQVEGIFRHIDVLSTPSMPAPAPALNQGSSIAMTAPFNALGWPAITVPVGWTDTLLPLGLQLVARPWDEATLLQVAAVLEAAQPRRKSSHT